MTNEIKRNDNNLSLWDTFSNFWNDAFSREMKTDISEDDKEYIVTVDMPGIDKKNVELSYSDDTLTVHVKKEEENKEKEKAFIRKERTSMDMTRSFYLENVDENKIEAKMENGVLTLTLPKMKEAPNPKKVISID